MMRFTTNDLIWLAAWLLVVAGWWDSDRRRQSIDSQWSAVSDRQNVLIDQYHAEAIQDANRIIELELKQKLSDWFWSGADDWNPDGIKIYPIERNPSAEELAEK